LNRIKAMTGKVGWLDTFNYERGWYTLRCKCVKLICLTLCSFLFQSETGNPFETIQLTK
jgi:hypothetical protein